MALWVILWLLGLLIPKECHCFVREQQIRASMTSLIDGRQSINLREKNSVVCWVHTPLCRILASRFEEKTLAYHCHHADIWWVSGMTIDDSSLINASLSFSALIFNDSATMHFMQVHARTTPDIRGKIRGKCIQPSHFSHTLKLVDFLFVLIHSRISGG